MSEKMLNKIRNKIKEFENRFRKIDKANSISVHNQEILQQNDQIVFDFNVIQSVVGNIYLPFTNWSLSPSSLVHIFNDIILNDRKSIIEFGLGTSSICIAKFIESQNLDLKFKVVESDEEWIEKMERIFERYNLKDKVEVIFSPIVNVEKKFAYRNQNTWFEVSKIEEQMRNVKFDLIIVDAPIGSITSFSRYSAVPVLLQKIEDDFSVFLDDTFRKDERQILSEWQNILPGRIKHYNKYSLLSSPNSFDCEPFEINKWKK